MPANAGTELFAATVGDAENAFYPDSRKYSQVGVTIGLVGIMR
jgi:hypothetical protein